MSELFILPQARPGDPEPTGWHAWHADRDDPVAERGQLQDIGQWRARHAADTPVVLLVPAEQLLLTEVTLPTRQASKRARALPFALEEHLLDEPGRVHCVAGAPAAVGPSAAAAVDHDHFAALLSQLAAAGLAPARALPDALCLPHEPGRLTLVDAGGRCLVRWGPAQATAMPSGEQDAWRDALGDALPTDAWTPAGDWREVLAAGAARAPLDLLQGEFAPAGQRGTLDHWRWPAKLTASVVVLALAVQWAEAWQLERHSARLADEIGQQYLELFPAAREVPADPAARVQIALREFGGAGGGNDGQLTHLLQRAAPLVAGDPDLALQQLRYQDGQLDLQLRARRVDQLDALVGRLENAGLSARLGATRVDGDRVSGNVQLRAATGAGA